MTVEKQMDDVLIRAVDSMSVKEDDDVKDFSDGDFIRALTTYFIVYASHNDPITANRMLDIADKLDNNISSEIIKHYDAILIDHGYSIMEDEIEPKTSGNHLRWMLNQLSTLDWDKANRWLGFIQGVMIMNGWTTVQAERDFTRGKF